MLWHSAPAPDRSLPGKSGRGGGWGRGRGFGFGRFGWAAAGVGYPAYGPAAPTREQELEGLKQQAAQVQGALEEINRRIQSLDLERMEMLHKASADIQQLIIRSPLPPELESGILSAYRNLEEKAGEFYEALRNILRKQKILRISRRPTGNLPCRSSEPISP